MTNLNTKTNSSSLGGTVPTHWILRVGTGTNFGRSRAFNCWGVNTARIWWVPNFLSNVREGDLLWFVQSNSKGKAIAVATFTRHCPRVLGPLVALTHTNEQLGWVDEDGEWDTEVHYTNLYDLSAIPHPVLTNIQSPLGIRVFNPFKCDVDLPKKYEGIVEWLTPA
jgi:hypothetical protein